LIMVPIVNPPNVRYRHLIHNAPRDRSYTFDMAYNTYLRWPGRPDGDAADRICHAIVTHLLLAAGVACAVDFHSWAWMSSTAGFPGGGREANDEVALGRKLGIPFFHEIGPWRYEAGKSPLAVYASHVLKVPGYLVEIRTQWIIRTAGREIGLRVIRNVCRHFKMMTGGFEPHPGGQCNMAEHKEHLIRAPFAGLYMPHTPIERMVNKGDMLGVLYNIATGESVEIVAPIGGYLWLNHRFGAAPDVRLTDMHAYADAGDLLVLIKHACNP